MRLMTMARTKSRKTATLRQEKNKLHSHSPKREALPSFLRSGSLNARCFSRASTAPQGAIKKASNEALNHASGTHLVLQEESIRAVTSILGCSPCTACKLLIHYRWDQEALFGIACPAAAALAKEVETLPELWADSDVPQSKFCVPGALADKGEESVYRAAGADVASKEYSAGTTGMQFHLSENLESWLYT